jgi:HlyD family secretion protein
MRTMFTPLLLSPLTLSLAACGQAIGSDQKPTEDRLWAATAVGRIDTEEEARHLVAAADGVIASIRVSRGDHVRRGQRLADIDCAPRAAEASAKAAEAQRVTQAVRTVSSGTSADRAIVQADIDAAMAVVANETRQLQRTEDVYRQGFLSQSSYDTKIQTKASAIAALQAAHARLDDLENGRRPAETAEAKVAAFAARQQAVAAQSLAEQCTVKSPVTGQILQILRREGEFSGASQGAPLIVVGDLSRLVVRAEINERDAILVHLGQSADIWIDGSKGHWSGKVTHLAAIMGRKSARSLDPTDRFDRDIREVFVRFDGESPPALVGLRVMVGLKK